MPLFSGVFSFLSVILIDNFPALLTAIFSPSLLGTFCLLMTPCIMNVTGICMHVIICCWIVTNTLIIIYYFVVWYCKYVSAVFDVGLMCCLLCVILLPFVVSCMTYVQS